ncbi:methionyl-tRNA formyltransferase [Streptomyces sp. 2224.1]|uniref:formyltransferase family protein n=1 Tax=unclassified Streptomyces TaxID=2593676 RepID=UPI0008881639|nr:MULTISPECIES: formyltransferase family protein [unclassified Streptomyces]PBC86576.1 methionyl-tRNA formyltransferase [Streptomyces sp. 2321.6]SDQ79589.1 methionyl-tRNA formyltransferase [Streptomyces sp. KS_16]SED57818.1 methionyl-tRNA formyltransferase [Streptomyces sp. 2112.3]SED87861.1 methionyl-tRNA formyltransferase [Streptomyces sp. 2224.1]SEE02821.1 methionyl-tRNA formyltransferase [Streptomyces sp. 2133.1]
MNIYISGQGAFAVQVADALLEEGHKIVGAAAPRLRKGHSDESNAMSWDRLRSWAYPRDIPWTDSAELRARHVPDGVDVIVAAHSHAFLGRHTRARAAVATIGYHPSLLPLHRGRDAIRWTIRDGDKVTGGSVYHLTERTDAGPLAAQEHLFVPPGSTAQSLWREHLAPLGVRLLLKVVADLAQDRRIEVPQDEKVATWEPAMDSPPLFKPELIALPGTASVDGSSWALHAQ